MRQTSEPMVADSEEREYWLRQLRLICLMLERGEPIRLSNGGHRHGSQRVAETHIYFDDARYEKLWRLLEDGGC